MNGVRRERRQADRDILRAAGQGRGIANPFSAVRDDGLARLHIEVPMLMVDAEGAVQDQRVLIEVRSLSRFLPPLGTAHVSYTDARRLRVHAPDIFIDEFGSGSSGLDTSGLSNQARHDLRIVANSRRPHSVPRFRSYTGSRI